jgi:hypothetical protein
VPVGTTGLHMWDFFDLVVLALASAALFVKCLICKSTRGA